MEEKNSKPLVTVIVVTYNSARFILETLESIKAQSYENIELIISDDCSKDNTVELCQDWISRNIARFSNVKLITAPQNTGTAGNANRALAVTTGEWVKFIAGDDLFCSDAIEKCINSISEDTSVYFAEAIHFTGKLSDSNFTYERIDIEGIAFGPHSTAISQYNILKRQFVGSGPGFFSKLSVIKEVGGFDERFPLLEDYPLFIKIAKHGYRFKIIDHYILYKRVDDQSVSHKKDNNAILTSIIVRCVTEYKHKYKYENLDSLWKLFLNYSLYINTLIIKNGNTYDKFICRLINRIRLLTDPFLWYSRYLDFRNKRGLY